MTPQQRSRDNLTERGYLVGTVEKRKKFPDRHKKPCGACGRPWMIEISSDLFEVFDMVALRPGRVNWGYGDAEIVFVQVTSRNNHSTRRNKILSSMEAKLVLLSNAKILIQSWGQDAKTKRWQPFDEWISLDQFKQAVSYPNTVAELMEIRRKAKLPDLPRHTDIDLDQLPF